MEAGDWAELEMERGTDINVIDWEKRELLTELRDCRLKNKSLLEYCRKFDREHSSCNADLRVNREGMTSLHRRAAVHETAVLKLNRDFGDTCRFQRSSLTSVDKPRTLYLGTDDVEGTPEAALRPMVYELYQSSPAVEVTFWGRTVPHGFTRVPLSEEPLMQEDLGSLDDGDVLSVDNVEALWDIPWELSEHGSCASVVHEDQNERCDLRTVRSEVAACRTELASETQRSNSLARTPEVLSTASQLTAAAGSVDHTQAEDTLPTPTSPRRPMTPLTGAASTLEPSNLAQHGHAHGSHAQRRKPLCTTHSPGAPRGKTAPKAALQDRSTSQKRPLPHYETPESDGSLIRARKRPRGFRQASYDPRCETSYRGGRY